jgi:hypothetical protein
MNKVTNRNGFYQEERFLKAGGAEFISPASLC